MLRLLGRLGYSLQANQETREGADHPDRETQVQYLSQTVAGAIERGQPAISVDARKREVVGDFKAVGREFEVKGKPVEVRTHDLRTSSLGTRPVRDLRSGPPMAVFTLSLKSGRRSEAGLSDRHRPIPKRYHVGMSKQIAVRLDDELVDFVDAIVDGGTERSRAAVVTRALERERRRMIAARDAEILAASGPDPELVGLAEHAAGVPIDR